MFFCILPRQNGLNAIAFSRHSVEPRALQSKNYYIHIIFLYFGGALVSTGLLKRELRAEGLVRLVKKPENNKC